LNLMGIRSISMILQQHSLNDLIEGISSNSPPSSAQAFR